MNKNRKILMENEIEIAKQNLISIYLNLKRNIKKVKIIIINNFFIT